MAKRTKAKGPAPTEGAPLSHNPFAALAPAPGAAPKDGAAKKDGPTRKDSAAPKDSPAPKNRGLDATPEHNLSLRQKLVLSREKKGRGGKTVTRLRGLSPDDLKPYQGLLKKALGCGASIEGEDLLLHGSLADRAADWLRQKGHTRVVVGN